MKPWKFQDMVFKSIPFPKRLKEQDHLQYGVNTVDRDGVTLRVTSNERTLVDLFDRPHWGGGWEEIWRSLESFDYFNINQVVEYALILGNATTVSKVGFFLEQHREEFMVEDEYLKPLLNYLPANPHYMERNKRQPGKLIKKWNLVVPDEIINRTWAEVL